MADIAVGPAAGHDAKLYYNSGTNASPTWVEITHAIDVAMSDYGVNAVAANARSSNYEGFVPGLIKSGATFTYLHKRGTDSVRTALLAMISGRTSVQFSIMDGGILLVGAVGLRAFFLLEKFAMTQGQEGAMVWDASLKPSTYYESGSLVSPSIVVIT